MCMVQEESHFKLHAGETLKMVKGSIVSISKTKTEHKNQHVGVVSKRRWSVKFNTLGQTFSIIPSI